MLKNLAHPRGAFGASHSELSRCGDGIIAFFAINDFPPQLLGKERTGAVGNEVKIAHTFATGLFRGGINKKISKAFASTFRSYSQHAKKTDVLDALNGHAANQRNLFVTWDHKVV